MARLGGDEFAVVCPNAQTTANLQVISDRILATLRAPVALSAGTFSIGASIGVRLSDGRSSPEELLHDADEAMYAAKKSGKNRSVTHDPDDTARGSRTTRLLPELHQALVAGEFVLHGQPVVDLATGRVIAVETLIRWQHPTRGLLPPAEFLDVAEASPLMVEIGRYVLARSCQMASEWSEVFGPDAPLVHVNVSGRQLETGSITRDILGVLHSSSLPAHRLVIELTETYVPLITDSLRRDLERLRERGVRIAIDDLGTGYSSLSRLTELPVDVLKIDRSFVAGMGVDRGCDAIVRGVLTIGQALGLSIVAEGVETPGQAAALVSYGADTAQGYLYSAARPQTALMDYIRSTITKPTAPQPEETPHPS